MDWRALGLAVVRRRVELGFDARKAFAVDAGLGERNLSDIEHGRRESYDAGYLARLERALQWPPGTVDAILNGLPAPEAHPRRPTEFGFYLLGAIRDAGTTPQALAEAAQVDRKAIAKLIYDHPPSLRVLERIAPALGVPQAELLARAQPDAVVDLPGRRLSTLSLLVDAAVADDSPLTPAERQQVATLVGYVLAPYEERLMDAVKRWTG